MKTKNIILLVIAIVSSIGGLLTALLLPEGDNFPSIAFAPVLAGAYGVLLYTRTYPEKSLPNNITPAMVYDYRRNSWLFRTLYHPFIFLDVYSYLMRNEWEKAEVLLDNLKEGYDPHPTTADYEEHQRQLKVGEHIKRLEQRIVIPAGLCYESLIYMVIHYRKYLLQLEEKLERRKNRKIYRDEVLAEIKHAQDALLEYEVLLAAEKARKTEIYKRIVLINLSKSLK